MTSEREFDRIAGAWLDLMPDEAPDRVIDAVLQAVDSTPQVRRSLPRIQLRSPRMTRFILVAAAALLGVAAIGGSLLVAGGAGRPAGPTTTPPSPPPASPDRPSAPPAALPAELVGSWFGDHRDLPGILSGSGTVLKLTANGAAFSAPNMQPTTLLGSTAAVDPTGRLRLTTASDPGPCGATDAGTYRWTLSAGGGVLQVTPDADDCATRAAAVGGTWWRAACKSGTGCLGDLEPGTYGSQYFNARANADGAWRPMFASLRYTVPAGWANSADWPSRFVLTPSASYARESADGAPDGLSHQVQVVAQPAAITQDGSCSPAPDASVERTLDGLTAWLEALPSIATTPATPLTIDGHPGRMLDATVDPAWTGRCPGEAAPSAALLTTAGTPADEPYTVWIIGSERKRIILLDLGAGDLVGIEIDDRDDAAGPDPARFDDLVRSAMPVVESLRFR